MSIAAVSFFFFIYFYLQLAFYGNLKCIFNYFFFFLFHLACSVSLYFAVLVFWFNNDDRSCDRCYFKWEDGGFRWPKTSTSLNTNLLKYLSSKNVVKASWLLANPQLFHLIAVYHFNQTMWLSQIFCIMGWLGIAFAKVFPPSFHLLLCFMLLCKVFR